MLPPSVRRRVKNKIQPQKDLGTWQDPRLRWLVLFPGLTDCEGIWPTAYTFHGRAFAIVCQIKALGTGDERLRRICPTFDQTSCKARQASLTDYYDESRLPLQIYAASDGNFWCRHCLSHVWFQLMSLRIVVPLPPSERDSGLEG